MDIDMNVPNGAEQPVHVAIKKVDGTTAEIGASYKVRDFTVGRDSQAAPARDFRYIELGSKRAIFDASGNAIYPIKQDEKAKGVRVVEHTSLDHNSIQDHGGEDVSLFLPRRQEFLATNHDTVRKLLVAYTVNPVIAHGYFHDEKNPDFPLQLAWIKGNYGIDTITMHPSSTNYGTVREKLEQHAYQLGYFGVEASFENLDTNKTWLTDPRMIADMNIPNVSLTLDISHLAPGYDLMSLVDAQKFLTSIHLNNRQGSKKDIPYRQGEFPVQQFLQTLRDQEWAGTIVLEYQPGFKGQKRDDKKRLEDFFA